MPPPLHDLDRRVGKIAGRDLAMVHDRARSIQTEMLRQAILPTLRTAASTSSASLDPFPDHLVGGAGRLQDESIAAKLIAAYEVGGVAGLHAALPVMGNGAGALVDAVGAEIGDVAGERGL